MGFYDDIPYDSGNDPYAPWMGADAPPQYIRPSFAEQAGIPEGNDVWDPSRLRLNGQMVPADMLPKPWVGMPKTQATLAEEAKDASNLPALLNQPRPLAYEPAQQMPQQGMFGNWLDNLATSLATHPLQSGNNFGGGLLSGFAQGFSGARLKNMGEREKLQKAMDDYAAKRNAANLQATEDARKARLAQLDALKKRALDRQKFMFEESFKAGLKKNADNTYTVTSDAMLPYLPGVKVGDSIPQSTYNAALNQYLDTKFPRPSQDSTTTIKVTPEAQKIADNIIAGRMAPDELSRFNNRGDFRNQVEVALSNAGFNAVDMQMQVGAEKQFWRTQNSPKFQTIRNNARQLQHSLDLIENLNTRLRALVPSSSIPEINRAQMELLIRQGGPAGRIARQLQTQINDTAGEIGGIIMGGNSPTDHALGLAQSNMQADWSAEDLQNAVKQARYNVGTRLQAMSDASVASAGDNIRAKVGSTFAALRAQGLSTTKDFDKNIDKKRADGKTLRQALNEQGWSDDDISTLRGKFN